MLLVPRAGRYRDSHANLQRTGGPIDANGRPSHASIIDVTELGHFARPSRSRRFCASIYFVWRALALGCLILVLSTVV